jgi:hypothetical protein
MATQGTNVLTLLDWAKRLDPNGRIEGIAEILTPRNPILQDLPFIEGNLPTGNLTTIRTGLGDAYWRLMNQGLPPSKSTTAQIQENTGMLERWSEVDKDLAELNGNLNDFRTSEAIPALQSMNKEMAETFFYGNGGTAPAEFNGIHIRYSDLSAGNTQNIIDGAGTGSDNTSILLVGYSPETVFGLYPKGSKAGLMHEDLGLVTVETTAGVAGNRMRAYQDHFQWKCGLCVKDWEFIVRIANIDVSNLAAQNSTTPDLITLMIKAMWRFPTLDGITPKFYMNRTCGQYLDLKRRDDVRDGGGLTWENVDGKVIYSFRGVQISINDALLDTEARVV